MPIISKFQIILLICVVGFTILLFYTSYASNQNKRYIHRLNHVLEQKQKTIQKLKIHLSFLQNPERVKVLVTKYLPDYVPLNTLETVSWENINNK